MNKKALPGPVLLPRSYHILISALLIIHLILAILGSFETNDDAFISFRYARNLIEGNGLVFNAGEHVEGYTNFLWVMLIAAGYRVIEPVLFSKILGVLSSLVLVLLFSRFCARTLGNLFWIPALYLTLDPSILYWCTRGLETSLFILLIWLLFACCRHTVYSANATTAFTAGIVTGTAALTRPEGLAAGMIFPLMWAGLSRKHRNRCSVRYLAGASLVLIPYIIWKLIYFGELLPNTFYAKTGGGAGVIWRGIAYIIQGWGLVEGVLLILISIAALRDLRRRRFRPETVISLFICLFLVYILKIGGDSLGPDRFLTPLIPLMLGAAVLYGSRRLIGTRYRYRRVVPFLAGVLLAFNCLPVAQRVTDPDVFQYTRELNHPRTRTGLCLREHAPPNASIATSVIGRLPYYSRLYTMDVFGLIDPRVARLPPVTGGTGAAGHEKTDWEYILSREPTFIAGRELMAAPPREPRWLRRVREIVTAYSTPAPAHAVNTVPGIPAPPYPGYTRVILECRSGKITLWKRQAPPLQKDTL
ncbi:MAG TPA: hypothetical protein PLV45_00050 [bacterium]|nr:hypothetical protein [bacterium]